MALPHTKIKVGKGPPSYSELRSVSHLMVDAIRTLNRLGVSWSAIYSMRGVTRVAVRFAGGYESASRKGPGVGGHNLRALLRHSQARLESAHFLSLYLAFDVHRERDELFIDPQAMLNAWVWFKSQYPTHRLAIQQAWLLARDGLQKNLHVVRCRDCGCSYLAASQMAREHPDYASLTSGCYVCDRRRMARIWHRNQQTKIARCAMSQKAAPNAIVGAR